GHDIGQRAPECVGFGTSDQSFRGPIQNADAALGVDPDDAGARSGQYGFGETTAAIDQVTRTYDVVALGPQLLRHLVEGFAQLGEHARIEQTCNVQIEVIVAAQLDDGGDVIVIEEHRHLRLGVIDGGQHLG